MARSIAISNLNITGMSFFLVDLIIRKLVFDIFIDSFVQ